MITNGILSFWCHPLLIYLGLIHTPTPAPRDSFMKADMMKKTGSLKAFIPQTSNTFGIFSSVLSLQDDEIYSHFKFICFIIHLKSLYIISDWLMKHKCFQMKNLSSVFVQNSFPSCFHHICCIRVHSVLF